MTHVLDPYTYILVDRKVVKHANNEAWFMWFGSTERHVAVTKHGPVIISTVFVGIDRSYGRAPHPLVFETAIFGGDHDGWEECSASWAEAEAVHADAVALIRPPQIPGL